MPPTGKTAEGDEHEFALQVGDAIRRGRQARGWTQVGLAEEAHITANYVARLERGELGPSFYVAHHLAQALGVDVDALLSPALEEAPPLTRRGMGRAG